MNVFIKLLEKSVDFQNECQYNDKIFIHDLQFPTLWSKRSRFTGFSNISKKEYSSQGIFLINLHHKL